MYDIYLFTCCRTLPDLDDLIEMIPFLEEPGVQARLLDCSHVPGELGLDLPLQLAQQLLERFCVVKSEGYLFPSAYHSPKVSAEQAFEIARQWMEHYQQEHPDDTIGPTTFFLRRETPVCWVFAATSEKLMKEDRIPGVIFAHVDKLDGHVWSWEEIYRLVGDL